MGGSAHLALMEMSVLLAVVGIAHVVHLIDGLARVLCKVFDGILIAEVVPAFDRVKRVRLDAVLVVRDSCDTVHASLCHRRCRARGHELRHDGDLQIPVLRCCKCRTHPGTPTADDEHIVGHVAAPYLCGNVLVPAAEVGAGHEHYACCRRTFDEGAS